MIVGLSLLGLVTATLAVWFLSKVCALDPPPAFADLAFTAAKMLLMMDIRFEGAADVWGGRV